MFFRPEPSMVSPADALPGRSEPMAGVPDLHLVTRAPLKPPFGDGVEVVYLAGGCFWGIERIFWRLDGVVSTAAGYMGGYTPNPTYEETCTGRTGHAEAVLVAYDPTVIGADRLFATFFENHDPTTPNRQGNDVGTQYRSAIYTSTPEQGEAAVAARDAFQKVLSDAGHGTITTELRPAEEAGPFYYAEELHQQYLEKNPGGYCNHGPNGYTCPVGLV
ncbi:peptide-methionine (S)-S-oxide reductase MsrA [Mobilicoccus caccae]|uniref:Peptide methionine sulfoxide reductase MsrA n=1 Tax=Mobilicoccus caccae TaxID=1859295 RepID=A0ABQ6IU52_9MICO|nr:peptide-methionine (S)-S-oxide reductase MsrA [Mobilicoccus caccae]GMA40667.1 peptide methionine sulfoxide reductase MsrA [Mobilicoccus caccae]